MTTPARRQPIFAVVLCALLAAGLACAVPGLGGPTPTPTAIVAYLGQFDCTGLEAGLGAYTGRLTFNAPPDAQFEAPNTNPVDGEYDFDATGNTYTFRAGFVFDSAIYDPNTDSLVATVAPGVELAHAEGGTVTCVRAQPGITGP